MIDNQTPSSEMASLNAGPIVVLAGLALSERAAWATHRLALERSDGGMAKRSQTRHLV
jgi:hypothetical protein